MPSRPRDRRQHRLRRVHALLTGLAVVVSGVAATPAPTSTEPLRDFIVVLRDGTDARAEARAVERAGWAVSRVYTEVLDGFAVRTTPTAAAALARNPRVVLVEADGIATTVTAGSQSGATWGLDRTDQRALPLNRTYNFPNRGSGVRAYVVDTGVLASHAEFGGRVVPGMTAIADAVGTSDCNGHGTHVAGTIAGATYGLAKDATVVPVRVLGCNGSGSLSGVIAGLDWIAKDPARTGPAVANMSLGSSASSSVDTAVRNLHNAGVTVVVAAGNSNANACNYSPAREPVAVTVGSTTSTDARSSFSNFGTCLDVFAPGSSITSAWYSSNTATNTISGTSMASPHVAGAAVLLLAADRSLSPSEVRDRLVTDATAGVVTSAGTGSPNRLLFVAASAGVATPLEVSTSALPRATVGSAYSTTLTSTGGSGASRTWSLTGGTMPGGLSLSSAGVLSGTPSSATTGTSLTFTVSDGTSTASRTLTLVIDAAPVPPAAVTINASLSNVLVTGKWLAAAAAVMTYDSSGPRPGVLVEGRWLRNGALLRRTSGTTGADGIVSFTSGTVKATTGTLTFCVDRLSGTGVTTRIYGDTELCRSVTK